MRSCPGQVARVLLHTSLQRHRRAARELAGAKPKGLELEGPVLRGFHG